MKTRRVPFDINKAKSGAKVVTRAGYPVRIKHFHGKIKPYTVIAFVEEGGKERTLCFTEIGQHVKCCKSKYDLFIEEEVEETDDYNPYKATVESIADMVERYSELQTLEELKHFYNNVKIKCRDAFEYGRVCMTNLDEEPDDIFKIKPDKWYVCTLGWESHGWDNDWKFVEGFTYPGSEILQCYPMDEKEIQNHFRLWTISDAKPGDILATENGYNILIFKNIKSSSGSGFSSYYNYNNLSDYSDFKEGSWDRNRFIPATKEQCDILFQKMKDAGYMWDSDKKELKKIDDKVKKEVKTRRMTYKELSWWLREHPEEHREYTHEDMRKSSLNVYSCYDYNTSYADEEVNEYIRIRKNGGEWQEPLIEE